jgi:hypothetical protein
MKALRVEYTFENGQSVAFERDEVTEKSKKLKVTLLYKGVEIFCSYEMFETSVANALQYIEYVKRHGGQL